ncbi:MAG: hypothetical protein IKZ49_01660 [Alphaproteobacteria bacterium]|nr:hypothetical protein [Alphaproteobacteria bacterium]
MEFNQEQYDKAKELVLKNNNPTISFVQRVMNVSYNIATSLIEKMEQDGFIVKESGGKYRIA